MSLTKSHPEFERRFQEEQWKEECRLADQEAQFFDERRLAQQGEKPELQTKEQSSHRDKTTKTK